MTLADVLDGLLGVARRELCAIGVFFQVREIAHERKRLHVDAVGDTVERVEAAVGREVLRLAAEMPLANGLVL